MSARGGGAPVFPGAPALVRNVKIGAADLLVGQKSLTFGIGKGRSSSRRTSSFHFAAITAKNSAGQRFTTLGVGKNSRRLEKNSWRVVKRIRRVVRATRRRLCFSAALKVQIG